MDNYDVIVIGGGPAGVISAITAKNCSYKEEKKSVLLIREFKISLIPCGIPFQYAGFSWEGYYGWCWIGK